MCLIKVGEFEISYTNMAGICMSQDFLISYKIYKYIKAKKFKEIQVKNLYNW